MYTDIYIDVCVHFNVVVNHLIRRRYDYQDDRYRFGFEDCRLHVELYSMAVLSKMFRLCPALRL